MLLLARKSCRVAATRGVGVLRRRAKHEVAGDGPRALQIEAEWPIAGCAHSTDTDDRTGAASPVLTAANEERRGL